MLSPDPDSALVARVAAHDEEALATLYDHLASRAYGLALRIGRNPGLAEEIVQDAFMRVWRQGVRYDPGRGAVRPWFLRLVRNLTIDRLRASGSRARAETQHRTDAADEATPSELPEDTAVRRERAVKIRAALSDLPPEQRRMIEIAYFEGLSHDEIATRERTPLGTVKTRIRKGVLRLRAHMTGEAINA